MAVPLPHRLPSFVLAWTLALLIAPALASAACSDTFTGNVDNTWETMGNWSSGIPGVSDHVCIPAGKSVTLSGGAVQVADLELDGSLNLTAPITVGPGAGESRFAGTLVAGVGGDISVQTNTVYDAGTLALDGGGLTVADGAELQVNGGVDISTLGGPVINNNGTISINPGAGGLTSITPPLNNAGVVSNSGPVTLTGGGSWSGIWKLGSGTGPDAPILNLGSGTYSLDGAISDAESGGGGQLEVGSASIQTTVDANHITVYDLNVSDPAAILDISPFGPTATAIDAQFVTTISNQFEVDAPLHAGTLNLRDGAAICNGAWVVDSFHFGGGVLSSGGPHGCKMAVGTFDMTVVAGDSGIRQAVDADITVSGAGTAETPYDSGSLALAGSSVLTIESGVRWVVAADVDITGSGSIVNHGTIDKTVGGGGDTTIDPLLDSDGTLAVTQGLMILTQLPVQYDGVSDALAGGTWVLAGTLRIPGPIGSLSAGVEFNGGGPHLEDSTNLNADALTTLTSNASGNTLTLSGGALLAPPSGTDFTNGGTIELSGTASISVDLGQSYVQNVSGASTNLRTAGATLTAGAVDLSRGTLGGIGTVNSNVTNSGGTVAPGNSPGTLTINGNFTQNGTGAYMEEIDGPLTGQFDKLQVIGTATLGGTLIIGSTNGYQAPDGQFLQIIDAAGGIAGTWGGVVQSPFVPYFDQIYLPNTMVLASQSVSVGDATQLEGNSGTTDFNFTISLGAASNTPVSVDWATQDGNATFPSDYTAANGTVTFAPGETTKTVTVAVVGDTVVEGDENFAINLSNPVNTRIRDGQGVGTITEDDSPQATTAQVPPGDIDGFPIPPPPVQGKAVNVQPLSGTVLVKLPRTTKFIRLPDAEQVPVGTIVDARRGKVRLFSVGTGGRVQFADFYEGVFEVEQKRGQALTVLKLVGGSFTGCPKAARARSAARKKKTASVRHLWGSGKGQFRTQGRYASATIRGTKWLTDDRCNGTLIRATVGAVTVRDLTLKKSLVLKKPKSYLAPARRR